MSYASSFNHWAEIHNALVQWERMLDTHPEETLRQMLRDQRREANITFSRFVAANYKDWISGGKNSPILSPGILDHFVVPQLKSSEGPVFFIVVDCMRYDQWLEMEGLVSELFTVKKDFYCGILPTATAYARNAIFSGLFPGDLETRFPHIWQGGSDDDEIRATNLKKTF